MQKPTIFYLLHCYYNTAGTEEHTRLLCKSLRHDYSCVICAPERDRILLFKEGKVIDSISVPPIHNLLAPESSPPHAAALQSLLRKTDPSIIHIQHTAGWPLDIFQTVMSGNVPVVMSFHDYFYLTPHYTMQGISDHRETLTSNYAQAFFGRDISPYLERRRELFRKLLKEIPCKICPSTYLKKVLSEVFASEYQVIAHGIEPFSPVKREENEPVTFGYIGSLLPQKGYVTLVNAFRNLVSHHPQTRLLLYGAGESLDRPTAQNIFYMGRYEQPDLSRILGTFDIGVIPSVFAETFCLTLSELWMGRKAVIASDIGALRERIVDGKSGALVEAGNASLLSARMEQVMQTGEWRTWDVPAVKSAKEMALDYHALYQGILQR